MAAVQFTNYYSTELTAAVAATDTTIQVMSVSSDILAHVTGGSWIYLTLVDANSWNNHLIPPATREIIKVTAITGTGPYTLTVTRAADQNPPATAQAFSKCDIAAFLLNAQSLYDIVGGGGGSGTVTSITATLPVVVTPSPLTTTGVVSANTMTGDTGTGGLRGVVPAPGAGDAAAGKFLKADATWAVPAGGGGAVSSVSSTDHILTFSPTTGAVVGSLATTTKGDLIVRSSTNNERLAVGTNTQVLTADSSQTLGVKWASIPSAGSSQSQEFTSSGTFTVPSGVTEVWITAIGGGGGGGGSDTAETVKAGGGGGSGELCQNVPVNVTGGGSVSVTIGAAGTGGVGSTGANGGDGGDTSFGAFPIVRGGKGGVGAAAGSPSIGGVGGGPGGGTAGSYSTPTGGNGARGSAEAPTYFGGAGGGGTASTTTGTGGNGGGAGGYIGGTGGAAAGGASGGGGGGSSIYGLGANGGVGGAVGNAATAANYGVGGGGAGSGHGNDRNGGDGAPGYCLVVWVA
jgi:hypothetical protein